MLRIAANISLMFREQPVLERFAAAKTAGFDGVEMQFPYAEAAGPLAAAVQAANIPVVLINAPVMPGSHPFGICGRPEMRQAFRKQLPQVCEYAGALGAKFVHILAGTVSAPAERELCWETYVDNLRHAADILGPRGIQVLIEPLNPFDAPDYLLGTLHDARRVLERCEGCVGLQFDAYHVVRMGLDPAIELRHALPAVRHVQFADAPGRHEPGTGGIAFEPILNELHAGGYRGWVSAEYLPSGVTVDGLKWLISWRDKYINIK